MATPVFARQSCRRASLLPVEQFACLNLSPPLPCQRSVRTGFSRQFSISASNDYPRASTRSNRKNDPNGQRGNKMRGASAIRGDGLPNGYTLSILAKDKNFKLPLPVKPSGSEVKKTIKVKSNHGLWGFFNKDKRILALPEDDHAHGRAWYVEELRKKSWDDLHKLWWTCVRELNRLATEQKEREHWRTEYGFWEAKERRKEVVKTQRNIRTVLIERQIAWEEAVTLAYDDPEINMNAREGVESVYTPRGDNNVFEDEVEASATSSTPAQQT